MRLGADIRTYIPRNALWVILGAFVCASLSACSACKKKSDDDDSEETETVEDIVPVAPPPDAPTSTVGAGGAPTWDPIDTGSGTSDGDSAVPALRSAGWCDVTKEGAIPAEVTEASSMVFIPDIENSANALPLALVSNVSGIVDGATAYSDDSYKRIYLTNFEDVVEVALTDGSAYDYYNDIVDVENIAYNDCGALADGSCLFITNWDPSDSTHKLHIFELDIDSGYGSDLSAPGPDAMWLRTLDLVGLPAGQSVGGFDLTTVDGSLNAYFFATVVDIANSIYAGTYVYVLNQSKWEVGNGGVVALENPMPMEFILLAYLKYREADFGFSLADNDRESYVRDFLETLPSGIRTKAEAYFDDVVGTAESSIETSAVLDELAAEREELLADDDMPDTLVLLNDLTDYDPDNPLGLLVVTEARFSKVSRNGDILALNTLLGPVEIKINSFGEGVLPANLEFASDTNYGFRMTNLTSAQRRENALLQLEAMDYFPSGTGLAFASERVPNLTSSAIPESGDGSVSDTSALMVASPCE